MTTHDQRNAAIKRRIGRKTRQLMRDVDTAMQWLVEHGYYNEDGTLTAAYGGKDVDKAAVQLNEMMEGWQMERWPTSEEVLAVLKERYPEEHKDTVTISYTPGFGGLRTAEDIAEIIHKTICQARDAMDVGFDEDIEPRPVAKLFAPRSYVDPFNIIEVVKAIPEKQHD